jgi:hypothetical protein
MKACIVRKVPYRIPQTNRLLWALILAERQGLSLLFVRKPDDNHSHSLVIATENVSDKVYENVNASTFPMEYRDLVDIGAKLDALGGGIAEEEFEAFFKPEDLW